MGLCKDGFWREYERYEGKTYTGCASARGMSLEEAQKVAKKAAMLDLAKKLNDAQSGSAILNKSTTVKSWSQTWLDIYIKPKVRQPGKPKQKSSMTQKSYATYEQKLDGYILPAIGNLSLKDVRDTHLQKILNKQAGKSKSHVSKICNVIKTLFRQAYVSRLISYDPSINLCLPAVTEGKRRSLTTDELTILQKACEIHRCGLWIETLLCTGIRPGESAPLLIKDFDFTKNLLSIDKDVESGTFSISDPKTKAGIRKIPIPTDLAPKLQRAFAGKSPFSYAFPQTNGKSMKSQECISNDWRSFLRVMDILDGAKTILIRKTTSRSKDNPVEKLTKEIRTVEEHGFKATAAGRIMTTEEDGENGSVLADDLVLYCLRHTYCTDLQRAGVAINIASYLMGHADIQTTANIYTHTGEEEALVAAVNINKYRGSLTAKESDLSKICLKPDDSITG